MQSTQPPFLVVTNPDNTLNIARAETVQTSRAEREMQRRRDQRLNAFTHQAGFDELTHIQHYQMELDETQRRIRTVGNDPLLLRPHQSRIMLRRVAASRQHLIYLRELEALQINALIRQLNPSEFVATTEVESREEESQDLPLHI